MTVTAPAARKATARDVREALRKRFAPPAWAVFDEVRNSTGHVKKPRHIDVLAMSLYPSRGIELHGVEIKVSRSDWIRERDDPEKAEAIASYCDRFWLAAGDASIVKDGELPAGWGLLLLKGEKLFTVKGAPELAAKPLDRHFVAAILRCAADREAHVRENFVSPEDVQRRIEAALAEGDAERRRDWEWQAQRELVELRRTVTWAETFERQTGISPSEDWHLRGPLREIAEALAAARFRSGPGAIKMVAQNLENNARNLRTALEELERARAAVEALTVSPPIDPPSEAP